MCHRSRRAPAGLDPVTAASGGCVRLRLAVPWADSWCALSRAFCPQCSADAGISAFPDGDNIFAWVGTIQGGAGTVRALRLACVEGTRLTRCALLRSAALRRCTRV